MIKTEKIIIKTGKYLGSRCLWNYLFLNSIHLEKKPIFRAYLPVKWKWK